MSREHREVLAIDGMPYLIAGGIGLEKGLDGRDGSGLFGLSVGDEFQELLFQ